ncbi:MAG: hypothetical protein A3J46_05100 [Candidatus Yanofskybacteria bacterium RIFCSPHIGHO2_02_FULL_41_11]|uniref:Uncharacterized protein n=1 Tax=Candidatus Yanofskybacteria bacterium RIFCSPHIGHO2_02_FULL_41_11 TaxID=1802675 RepID=A0A1F8F7I1_9BACT|nr:MAG: hypothetical protein A3J46_05100 [Candidatus Yanofskybacteria bacterium RIFCSPHIGHO2_02_FULL_41_11]
MKKITQKEFDKFVIPRLYFEGFSKTEREVVRSVFFSDLEDVESGERSTLFNTAVPGISEDELKKRFNGLRNPSSPLSKGLKLPLYKYPDKLNKLEEIMNKALEGNKEPWF